MDFQRLLARMVELDQPIKECGDMPIAASMAPMAPAAPTTPPASMSVNLNAHGMDDIESLLKLMTKVNPDMINQPAPAMPSLTPPGPSITSLNPDTGPLKMLPDFGDEPEGDHAEPDADNFGGPSDMDADNMPGGTDSVSKAQGDLDNDGDHDMDDHELEKEGPPDDDDEKKEEYANEPDEQHKSIDYMNNKLAGGMNRPKQTFPKVANGDNPMQRVKEGADLRASIRAELLQRLAEAKGAK
jgi:hypothetical protein